MGEIRFSIRSAVSIGWPFGQVAQAFCAAAIEMGNRKIRYV
jgi:hypothetical protein